MTFLNDLVYYTFHPSELRSIAQWQIWHNPVHERDFDADPISLKACFNHLDNTSRSFSAVIKELNPELLVPVCLFYLVLRGLDTIEDDMTIALKEKDSLLRDFHNILDKEGWTYNGSGPNEKDRNLLVQFHYVVTEFQKIKEPYRVIIKDICKKMGNGMADFCHSAEIGKGVETIEDYELYCHYVAGLVGEGLTRLFVESGLANPQLLQRPDLYESMGQLLQQTNVIRDIREDRDDNRRFWPKEVWGKYVDNFDDLFKPENRDTAMRCSAEMILIALNKVPDCLFYLAGIRDQSVFNFTSIPQSMAIATLNACFRNPKLFDPKPVKITKGEACQLMIESSQNLQILYNTFKERARKLHKKNDPMDPNFIKVSMACGQIEQFIESIFPTQGPRVAQTAATTNGDTPALVEELTEHQKKALEKKKQEEKESKQDMMIMMAAVMIFMLILASMMMGVAYYFGARFDIVFSELGNGLSNLLTDYGLKSPSASPNANVQKPLQREL